MENSPKFFDPQILARLRGLRLRAQHIVEGCVAGLHRSPFRGYSIEFAEHRQYVPGDDLRHLDWKVLGRTDKVYIKQFEDETNLVCQLVVDVSESMGYQGPRAAMSKWEYAQCLAASLAWLVLLGQDSAGLTLVDQQVRKHVPGAGHPAQLPAILGPLEQARLSKATGSIAHGLDQVAELMRRRGVVVVVSDLLDDPRSILAALGRFAFRRHDLIVFHLADPDELEFPFDQPTMFRGMEGLPDLPANPQGIRQAYLEEVASWRATLEQGCHSQGVDYQLLRTDQPLDRALAHYLLGRSHRVR